MDTNESNNEVSELIFIRQGKVFRKKFPYNINHKNSPEEEKLIMESLGISKEECDKLSIPERYAALTDSGWTIIRKTSDSQYFNHMFIGNHITQADYEAVMGLLNSEEENIKIDANNIYSRTNFKYGRQYEGVDLNNISSKYVADIFMRDKLGQTTDYEKEMLEHFRTFDLERIITRADFKYPLNNRDCGLIVITQDEFLTNPCSGIGAQHSSAVSDILMNKYNKLYKKNIDYTFHVGTDIFESVMIQCSNMGDYGEFLIWTPYKLNEFQYESLLKLQDTLKAIGERTGKTISVNYTFTNERQEKDEREDTPDAYKEYLIANHDSIVDNSLRPTPEKSSMPEYRMITEQEVCGCMGIEIPKTKRIAERVKNELFEKARKGLNLLSSDTRNLFRRKDKERQDR